MLGYGAAGGGDGAPVGLVLDVFQVAHEQAFLVQVVDLADEAGQGAGGGANRDDGGAAHRERHGSRPQQQTQHAECRRVRNAGQDRGEDSGAGGEAGEACLLLFGGLGHAAEVVQQEGGDAVQPDLGRGMGGGQQLGDQAAGAGVLRPHLEGQVAAPGGDEGGPGGGQRHHHDHRQ